MNLIKTLRKPYLSIFLASLVLFVSCSQYDNENIQKFDDASLNIAKSQLDNFTLTAKKSSDADMNHQIMNYFENQNNVNLEFSNTLYELNEKTTDKKIEIALQSGILNQEDLTLIQNLENNLKNDNFSSVISNFEENVLSLNLSNEKFEVYNTFVNALKLTNTIDSSLFRSNDYAAKSFDFDCVLATVAFAAAAVGLATLEVGTGGLATAAVVVGYIAASAAWVKACR